MDERVAKLFDPDREPNVPPEDAVLIVHRFLLRCRAYAHEQQIPPRLVKLSENPTPEAAAKLHAWVSYAAFVDHALAEIEAGDLDEWFANAGRL